MFCVIIERRVAEGLEPFYEKAIAGVMQGVAGSPGYLSGEALVDVERPGHYVVITRWANRDAWRRWFDSPERHRVVDAVRPFLLDDEEITELRNLYGPRPA